MSIVLQSLTEKLKFCFLVNVIYAMKNISIKSLRNKRNPKFSNLQYVQSNNSFNSSAASLLPFFPIPVHHLESQVCHTYLLILIRKLYFTMELRHVYKFSTCHMSLRNITCVKSASYTVNTIN